MQATTATHALPFPVRREADTNQHERKSAHLARGEFPSAPKRLGPPEGRFDQVTRVLGEGFSDYRPYLENAGIAVMVVLARSFLSNVTRRRHLNDIQFDLKPEPEAFHMDPKMGELFMDLQQYRHWNESAFCNALENTDKLFAHEKGIRDGGAEFGDMSIVLTYISTVELNLIDLKEAIDDARQRAEVQSTCEAISERLSKHNRNIIRRASEIYQGLQYFAPRAPPQARAQPQAQRPSERK